MHRPSVVIAGLVAACSGEATTVTTTTATVVHPPVAVATINAAAPDAAGPDAVVVDARAPALELAFVGDVNFGGYYDDHYDPQEVETHDPLGDMDPLLASDLTVANLETTIARTLPANGAAHAGQGNKRFVTIPERVAILTRHAIHTVTLANNHQFDNGVPGLVDTPVILAELGITAFGAARPDEPSIRVETIVVKGWRIGVVSLTTKLNRTPAKDARPIIAFADDQHFVGAVVPVVTAARRDHDLVIVAVHWGVEYSDAPETWQVLAAHALVDAGADAVIGHHPHVMQGIERYHGGVAAYSLGNFLFDNDWQIKHDSGVLHLTFAGATDTTPTCLRDARLRPTTIERGPKGKPAYHPLPAATMHATKRIATRLQTLSSARPFRSKWRLDGDDVVATPACPTPAGAP